MEKQNIFIALGDDSQQEATSNKIIQAIIKKYNDACTAARVDLANELSHNTDLSLEVKTRVMEFVGGIPCDLPEVDIVNTGRYALIGEASSIMGEDFILPGQIVGMFPEFSISKPEDMQLPFLVSTLEKTKKAGMVLLYQPTVSGKAIDLTVFAEMQKKLSAKPDGELLYRTQFTKNGVVSKEAWFKKGYDVYCNQQIVRPGWRLATKNIIEGTRNKKLVAQIVVVCLWLEGFYGKVMPEHFQKAITEIRQKQTLLEDLQDNNVPEFLKEIQQTLFWKYCMETGLETLFRLISYNQVTSQKLLPAIYTRNSVVEPVAGSVGDSGDFADVGPVLDAEYPWAEWSIEGLVFSCTMG